MYPTISHMLKDLLGLDIPLPVATFGFFLILSIYVAGLVLAHEIKRRKTPKSFPAFEETFVEGKPPSLGEIFMASIGFFLVVAIISGFLIWPFLIRRQKQRKKLRFSQEPSTRWVRGLQN